MKNYSQIAKKYAEDVLAGEVSACQYVIQACTRHLADLESESEYYFDEEAANRFCAFAEYMHHTKGKWAAKNETIVLQPWQMFIFCVVFGWKRKKDDFRRFRTVYVEVPRKNSKSTMSAAVGLYVLAMEGDAGAEVYSGATTEKQAKIVFDMAKVMARKNPDFKKLGVEVMASNLSIPANNSKFEPVIGKPGDGASPSCAIVDEFHEHASDELYDTMLTGMGAREQPLMWVITTAGSDTSGPCYALRKDVINMLDGSIPNDELFGLVYTLDESDDWTTEAALRKANPNYDVSVSGDFLKAQVRDAVNSSRKQNVVKTKHLNVWVGAKSAWMNMEAWSNCASNELLESFKGELCWIGLDLASKIDIASKVRVFKRDDIYYLFSTNYLPEERVNDPDKSHYAGWVHDSHLISTEGDAIDYSRVREDLFEDARNYDIAAIGYDPWNATQLATELLEEGLNAIEIRQSVKQFSEPMKELEAAVISRKLKHDDNPCFNWMMGNVVARVDANDNIYPRKEREENKIDGPVAAIMALSMCLTQTESTASVYDERGILTI